MPSAYACRASRSAPIGCWRRSKGGTHNMQAFGYSNPSTVQEAVGLLGSRWGEVDVLAGGTDLISLMKEHLATPKRLVNIKNIKELGGIQDSKAGLRIGATVTLDELLESADVRKSFPSLTQAAQGV